MTSNVNTSRSENYVNRLAITEQSSKTQQLGISNLIRRVLSGLL